MNSKSSTPSRAPIPPAPADLSPETAELWPGLAEDVRTTMGGGDVDYLALADTLRIRDRLAAVRTTIAAEGVTVEGSKGQTRPHPLLAVEVSLVRQVADGMTRLRLGGAERWRYSVDPEGRLR